CSRASDQRASGLTLAHHVMTLPDRENLKYRKAIRLSRYQDPAGFFIVIVGLDPSSCVTTHNLICSGQFSTTRGRDRCLVEPGQDGGQAMPAPVHRPIAVEIVLMRVRRRAWRQTSRLAGRPPQPRLFL